MDHSRPESNQELDHHSGAPRNRRERRQTEIRERLVRSALALFAERGFSATTVEDITNRADVGKGTFFNYFAGKDYIFAACVQGQVQKIQRFVAQTRHSREPMNELLYRLAVFVVGDAGDSPPMLHSILVAAFSNESVRTIMADELEKGRESLEELFALGQQRGEIRDDLATHKIILGFQRALLGTVFLWSLAPSRPLADCLREMSDIVWSAIRRRQT